MSLRSILRLVCDIPICLYPLLTKAIDTVEISPRIFWKENQHRYPALASVARDVLSIPATGAGVERLFNSA